MARRVTMKDVAERAGVSPSTVCRALGANPQIPETTRARIRKVAELLGYRPDPLLSAFASRRRGKTMEATTIAYLTGFPTATQWQRNPFYRKAFEGAESRALELGYRLEHFWLKEAGMTGERLSRILYNRGISAICVAPTPGVRGHLTLDWARFSCVTMGYSLLRPPIHRSTPHHFHGMLMAVRQLRRLGYRRIGLCVFTETNRRVDELWLAGFLLCRENLSGARMPIFLFDTRTVKQIPAWCRREKLEVVLGGEPVVLEELQREGLFQAPVDYATLNWIEEEPAIAGVDQQPAKIGAVSVDLLVAQMQRGERGIPDISITTIVEGRWMPGESLRRGLG